MEGHGRLWIRMAGTALAGLECVNTALLEALHGLPNTGVNSARLPWRWRGFLAFRNRNGRPGGSMNRRPNLQDFDFGVACPPHVLFWDIFFHKRTFQAPPKEQSKWC